MQLKVKCIFLSGDFFFFFLNVLFTCWNIFLILCRKIFFPLWSFIPFQGWKRFSSLRGRTEQPIYNTVITADLKPGNLQIGSTIKESTRMQAFPCSQRNVRCVYRWYILRDGISHHYCIMQCRRNIKEVDTEHINRR